MYYLKIFSLVLLTVVIFILHFSLLGLLLLFDGITSLLEEGKDKTKLWLYKMWRDV